MVYEFTDCTFENNYHETSADHEDGGGSGIWIANNKQIAAGRLMQIYFTGIKFINNRSPSVGGAFAYGRSPTVYPSELYFDSCQFDGNTAKTDGGALWVITKSPYEIQYCSFKNNLAERKGGSIMVETLAPIATIQTSSFEMESANNDGNAIYVSDKTPRFILSETTSLIAVLIRTLSQLIQQLQELKEIQSNSTMNLKHAEVLI